MTRISNKDKALAYAADKGIILTMEDADAGDKNIVRTDIEHTYEVGYFDVNCNGCGSLIRNGGTLYASHLSERNSYSHTYFAHGNTEPRAWADALAYMQRLTECPADCTCRS